MILPVIALVLWSLGFLIMLHLARSRRAEPGTVACLDPAQSLSVIIPARNEAHNLPRLLASLVGQPSPPLEVLVVDDASTDGTAAVGREGGATVITSEPLPEDWRGKPWACHQGARASRGEYLLFLDADTWLEQDGLEGILARYHGGALSISPYHVLQRPYEQLSAFFNLVMNAAIVPTGLFGQMLLIDRASYHAAGGHEAVRNHVLENMRMAGRLSAVGVPTSSTVGRRLVAFRMYPNGPADLMRGWIKGFASGAGATPPFRVLLVCAWFTGLTMSAGLLSRPSLGVWLYILCAIQVYCVLRQVGSFRWYAAMLYPVPLVFFYVIFTLGVLRSGKEVTWKGRVIHAD